MNVVRASITKKGSFVYFGRRQEKEWNGSRRKAYARSRMRAMLGSGSKVEREAEDEGLHGWVQGGGWGFKDEACQVSGSAGGRQRSDAARPEEIGRYHTYLYMLPEQCCFIEIHNSVGR